MVSLVMSGLFPPPKRHTYHGDCSRCSAGEPDVKSVQPFTQVYLKQIPFVDILKNFQILEAGNVPVNPLVFLYPNTPKDDAFGKYYTAESGGSRPFLLTCRKPMSTRVCERH